MTPRTHIGRLTYGDGTPLEGGGMTVYTHVTDKGRVRHWHIDRLLRLAREMETHLIPVEEEMVSVILERRGIEAHRLDRLTKEDLKHPIIFVEIEGESPDEPPLSHLLVDGNHRYVRAYQMGLRELPAVIFPKHVSDRCLILGLPDVDRETVLTMESGIT